MVEKVVSDSTVSIFEVKISEKFQSSTHHLVVGHF